MTIKTESILLNTNELNDLDQYREQYKNAKDTNKYFFLVACGFRDLQQSDFPDGTNVIRFSVTKDTTELDEEAIADLQKAAVELLRIDEYPLPSKGEFTKITTPDGKLAYIAKFSPNHDSTVARILEEWTTVEVRSDIQAAVK